ncbi:trypsin-like serine peptidase [Pannonibacter tanglangensis]|uniref:Serine protease n=1 Tax=Pannonibacter tanglangensis TaxID=2750084 RepID=A0ABW9ZF10_9HYPH|nr:serine protease [Pannonibacter sp. XCT-34]NBN62587.1 hypothetical protein [Pannonibacter sp. XCT-34]
MGISLDQIGDPLALEAAERLRSRLPALARAQHYARRGLVPPTESPARIDRFREATARSLPSERAILAEAVLAPLGDRPDATADTAPRPGAHRAAARETVPGETATGASVAVATGTTGLEALIGASDLLSIEFLEAGLLAARAVARIQIPGTGLFGTGFLVGDGLFLTNHHVFPVPALAAAAEIAFGYEDQIFGTPVAPATFVADPTGFFLTDPAFDYTLVALSSHSDTGLPVGAFGWHPLLEDGKILEGHPVAIIQHPQGRPKTIALHNSHFLIVDDGSLDDRFCWYSGDTERGSSGAPVFSRDWQVVALHHKAVPRTNRRNEILDRFGKTMSRARYEASPELVDHIANEGIRASRLRQALAAATCPDAGQAARRDALIALWSGPQARSLRARFA